MAAINPQAEDLNVIIKENNPMIYEVLSKRGKAIYFPKKGILAQGADAKNAEIDATLGTAYTDDKKPMVLGDVASKLLIDPKDAFLYAPSFGVKKLRDKWQELLFEKNPSLKGKAISLPIVSCALTHGLSMVGYLFVDEGDQIILPDLCWDNYELTLGNAYGCEFKRFEFFKGNEFNCEGLAAALNEKVPGQKKKIVLLNFPNNPTGYSPTIRDASKIIEILKDAADAGNQIVACFDDAYLGLWFEEDTCKESLFGRAADLHQNILAVKVDGITKEEYAWGFRVGFITYGIKGATPKLYEALELKTAGAVRGSISNAPNISQSLILQALDSPNYHRQKEDNKNKLAERYHIVKKVLAEHPEYSEFFEALPYNAGYFMCVRVKKHTAESIRQILLKKYSVGLIALGNLLRVAFSATPTNKLEKLFNSIYLACRDAENQ